MTLDLTKLRQLIVDMDGVLWHGETAAPGMRTFFRILERRKIRYVLATNNATKTASQYTEKLAAFGVAVPEHLILSSAEATAAYLKSRFPPGATLYAVGESGLRLALQAQGFRLLEKDGFVGPALRVQAVVVGYNRHVHYKQLASAVHLINNGAAFIGTNPDVTFPSEYGPLPGAGASLAFIEAATGLQPVVIGKPNRAMFDEALRRLGGDHDQTAMIGDRLNTDIAGAHRAGLRTILLLSGIARREDISSAAIKPDWIFEDLQSLAAALDYESD